MSDHIESSTATTGHRAVIDWHLRIRREDSGAAFDYLIKYLGIIYSGGTIAVLGFIASSYRYGVPLLSIFSLGLLIFTMLSFGLFLYRNYLLYLSRWSYFAINVDRYLRSEISFDDLMRRRRNFESGWLYRLMFWVPFVSASIAFAFGLLGALNIGGQINPGQAIFQMPAVVNSSSGR